MQNEQGKIEHELVAKRWYLVQDPTIPEIMELQSIRSAIPLRNVIDWEECDPEWHEDAPTERITAVVMPYETKFVEIPFNDFHNIMRRYRQHERGEARWPRVN